MEGLLEIYNEKKTTSKKVITNKDGFLAQETTKHVKFKEEKIY